MTEAVKNGESDIDVQDFLEKSHKKSKETLMNLAESDIDDPAVFMLQICDAWLRERSRMTLYESGKFFLRIRDKDLTLHIENNASEKLKAIVEKYSAKISADDFYVEHDKYYDGFIYRLMATDGSSAIYGIYLSNLKYYNESESPNGYAVFSLICDVAEYLGGFTDTDILRIVKEPHLLMSGNWGVIFAEKKPVQ